MKSTQLNSNGLGVNRVVDDGQGIGTHTPYHALCDYAGREAMIAGFGEQITGFKRPDILTVFNYFINPNQVKTTSSTGSFSITSDNSRLKLTAGISGVGSAVVESLDNIVYRPGFDCYIVVTAAYGEDLPGTTQEFGPHDDINGYGLALIGGQLAAKHYRGGSVISTTLANNFNLDKLDGTGLSGFTVNPQAINIYRISYGYLGVFPVTFEIYAGHKIGWVPFHNIDVTGIDNSLIIEDPYLPIRFDVTSDGINEISMFSGSWDGGVIAGPINNRLSDGFTVDNLISALNGGNVVKPLMSIRNVVTFKSKLNKIVTDLRTVSASVDGNKLHSLCLFLNATLTDESFVSVDTSSIMLVDKVATAITGGRLLKVFNLGRVDSFGGGVNFDFGEIRIRPGDTLSFTTVTASNSSDINVALNWNELK